MGEADAAVAARVGPDDDDDAAQAYLAVEEVVDLSRPHAERKIAQNAGHDVNLFDSEAWISMRLAYRFAPSAPHHCLPRAAFDSETAMPPR
ncbi:hypothetical protein [Mesorhizobium sp.]|uniref:hypothetical protein n=1 Tax=Mesorhizobium sp. TaxID=1871066 RepID=UPI0025ED3B23|nr:hypothetical protein [Mesorhizobium sp.]